MESYSSSTVSEKIEIDDENQTLNLSKLEDKIQLNFDYEINNCKIEEDDDNKNNKLLYYDENRKEFSQINYSLYFDKLRPLPKVIPTKDPRKAKFNTSEYDAEFEELEETDNDGLKKANFFKRLVSKQKRRFQDTEFDLDMAYITEKVIAMGFPSTGMETIYRNSLTDIAKFFEIRHKNEVKIYNLCLEKERIYNKNLFPKLKVGLFPATDHNPSPIKLILEFCIDICLYLIKHPNGAAAVHCKAGKGRTGVMICSYLVFSGLCRNSEMAFRYYARIRTKNNTGVTIASQRRYIKYFETFLKTNYYQPYIKLIPKIIEGNFSFLMDKNNNVRIKNILQSFQSEKSYFISSNKFKLRGVKLGPLPRGKNLKIKVCNFVDSKFKLQKKILEESYKFDNAKSFYHLNFLPELIIHSDIKVAIKNDLNFFLWVNLWFSTLEMIRIFYAKYGVKRRKAEEVKSITDIKFSDLVTVKKEEKTNKNVMSNLDEEDLDNQKYLENSEDKTLYDKILNMKHNTDLNELIDEVNANSTEVFERDNMSIRVKCTEFDKFQEKKEYDNFEMTIYYSIIDK